MSESVLKQLRRQNIQLLKQYWQAGIIGGSFVLAVENLLLVQRPSLKRYEEQIDYYNKKLEEHRDLMQK